MLPQMTIQDYQDLIEGKDREINFLISTLNKYKAENEKLQRDKDNWKGMYENACNQKTNPKWQEYYNNLKSEFDKYKSEQGDLKTCLIKANSKLSRIAGILKDS